MEAMHQAGRHCILYDPEVLSGPRAGWFDPDWWRAQGRVQSYAAGRGTLHRVSTPAGPAVLRRYRRGGWMARLNRDRYLYTGFDRSRGFREWRLLRMLREYGLPVPRPLAASCEPAGLIYRAGLLTGLIADAETLADAARSGRMDAADWEALGRTLAGFFARGVAHPDLNARNILRDAEGRFSLLDFDRASIRPEPIGGRRVIARLRRSLDKLNLSCDPDALQRGLSGG